MSYSRAQVTALVELAIGGASASRLAEAITANSGLDARVTAEMADSVRAVFTGAYNDFNDAPNGASRARLRLIEAGYDADNIINFTQECVRLMRTNNARAYDEPEDMPDEVGSDAALVRSITVEQYADGTFRVRGHSGVIHNVAVLEDTLRSILSA